MKDSKPYLSVFSFTFLQSECIKRLNNSILIIFENIGVGIAPGADSIRALRPDFQVSFLTLTFLFGVCPGFKGLFARNRADSTERKHQRLYTDFAIIRWPVCSVTSKRSDLSVFLFWMIRLCDRELVL